MSDVSMEIRAAITDVLHHFYWLVDQGRAAETSAMFTDDASITFGPGTPKPGTITGAQVRAAMVARGEQTHVTTRHAVSNLLFSAGSDGRITVRSVLVFFRSDDASRDSHPTLVADVEEVFAQVEGAWRFAFRRIMPVFARGSG